jgi:hypothetical protein
VLKKNLNPLIGVCGALKIVKDRSELRKLQAPKVKGGQELKKNKPLNVTKPVLNHSKNSLYVAMLLIELKDDL